MGGRFFFLLRAHLPYRFPVTGWSTLSVFSPLEVSLDGVVSSPALGRIDGRFPSGVGDPLWELRSFERCQFGRLEVTRSNPRYPNRYTFPIRRGIPLVDKAVILHGEIRRFRYRQPLTNPEHAPLGDRPPKCSDDLARLPANMARIL